MTTWKGRTGYQKDRGYITDQDGETLASNTGQRILFHTGISVKRKTSWTQVR